MPKYKNTLSRVIAAVYPAGGGRNGKATKAPARQHGPKRLKSKLDLKGMVALSEMLDGKRTTRWSKRLQLDSTNEAGHKRSKD